MMIGCIQNAQSPKKNGTGRSDHVPDPGTSVIYVGRGDDVGNHVSWNTDALIGGLYEADATGNQASIMNPSGGLAIGAWIIPASLGNSSTCTMDAVKMAKIHPTTGHLNHMHIWRLK